MNPKNKIHDQNIDNSLETMKHRLDLLKRVRFLQKNLIKISFRHDQGRPEIYGCLLRSLKLTKESLQKINHLTRGYKHGQ
ncbi:MAG: hypothetical protein L3J83_11180 [Proteobacteria bacterium]|nr:hypothetical protein [Pseudomonadota bacterium]